MMEDEDDLDKQVMNDVSSIISSLVSTAGLENIFRDITQDKNPFNQYVNNQVDEKFFIKCFFFCKEKESKISA